MGIAHAHDGLVEVDAWCVHSSELKVLGHGLVGLFGVEVLHAGCVGGEWCDAVHQSLLHEVVAKVHIVFLSYCQCHIDGARPVGVGNHLEHHQVSLVQCSLAL